MTEVVLVEAADTFTHVSVRGNLDEAGVAQVDLALTTQTVARRKPVILDLNEVDLITSLGIGLLVSIARSMRSLKLGFVVVVGPTHTRDVLKLIKIDALVPLFETRADALQAMGLNPDSPS